MKISLLKIRSICLFLLPAMLFSSSIFAQAERVENKYSASRFKDFHNRNSIDSIYQLFSPEMQVALPREKAHEFLGALKAQAGAIRRMDFKKYEGPYASYKTSFDKGTFAVNIALDANHRINGFFVKPYEDESLIKPERTVTPLSLPFKDKWTVVWGGDSRELNYHVEDVAQKNAFDFVITGINGKSFKTSGKTNEEREIYSQFTFLE